MSTVFQGKNGVVKFKTNAGALEAMFAITSWSYEESVEEAEYTYMGAPGKLYFGGINDGTGSVEGWWSDDDTGDVNQDVMTQLKAGTGCEVEIYPAGTGSTETYFKPSTANGIVCKSYTISADKDGIVTFGFTFRGVLETDVVT